jgi:thioredoxin-like negative regulator of GroEL
MKRALAAVGLLAGFALLAPAGSALAQTGGVRGTVVDTAEAPVAEALVVLEFQGGMNRRYELQTDKNGRYVQMGLTIGPYRITGSKEGYHPGIIEVRIRLGASDVPNVVLTPVQPADSGVAELRAKFAEGVELAQAGQLDDAEVAFKEILEARPDIVEVHQNLAYVYVKREDWASAEATYLAALDLRPGSSELMTALAKVYQDSGQQEKAMEILDQVGGGDTADGRAQFNKGTVLLDGGSSQEAQAAFEAALAADPPVAEAHYYLGTILVGQGKVPEAVEHLEAYLASDPKDGPNKETAMGLLEALK